MQETKKIQQAQGQRKALLFDLDTKKLAQLHPSGHRRQAYRDIQRFLEDHGFQRTQWSVYHSREPMSDIQAMEVAKKLANTFSWFIPCANRFSMHTVPEMHDVLYSLKANQAYSPESPQKQRCPEPIVLGQKLAQARRELAQRARKEPAKKRDKPPPER